MVGQVVPWNFPLLMAAWKLAPALATGNTAVLKPAETTPLTALLLAEICQEAELPDGVVNIVTGDGAAGAALVRSDVDKVAFTGSTAVGKEIQRALAGSGTGLTLELGGKSANIVFEDAALDQAVEGIIEGIFFNQGHVCCAGSRLLLQESVADEVVRKLWARMERLRVGDPLDKNTDVGAINSAAQLARISELVDEGEREGATRRSITCALPETGYWFPPTLFLDVAPANRIAVEEIFGPVVSVTTFRTPKEAIERANNSAYGLAAGVWTDNGSKAFEVACALRAGVVWQNTYNRFDPTAAFGGYKESGFGREGGPAGLLPYVRLTMSRRAVVAKTYKLYLGGKFARSESGRSDPATDHAGEHVGNVPRSSRKDVRDAVKAARGAQAGWAARTAYNRGQVLYRFAEALESRSDELRAPRSRSRTSRSPPPRRAGRGGRHARALRGLDRQARRRDGRHQPGCRAVPELLHARADRRRRRARARRARPAGADPRGRARAGGGQHRRRPRSRGAGRCARSTSARSRACPTSRAARSTCSAGGSTSCSRRCAATATSTPSSTRPATPKRAATIDELAAETVKRVKPPGRRRRARSRAWRR